jgi:hypothetical protein
MVAYGLATEKDLLDIVEHQLRDELLSASGLRPLNWLMIGQWARKTASRPRTLYAIKNDYDAMTVATWLQEPANPVT